MARFVLLLISGAIAGGVAVHYGAPYFSAADMPSSSALSREAGSDENPGLAIEPTQATGALDARVAAFERALAATDPIDLETMMDIAVSSPRSRTRDLEIRSLMARLIEIDPYRAVAYARSSFLETATVIQAFEALARVDADAAIRELRTITPVARQREIALAVLDVFGNDADGIERVTSALPETDARAFEIDALIARAESDPIAALQDAMNFDLVSQQAYLLPKIAGILASQDPLGALGLVDSFDDLNARRTFQNALIRAWAELDAAAVFDWLSALPPIELSAATGAFAALASSDVERLMAMAETFPPAVKSSAMNSIVDSIAARDPLAAIAMLDTMPAGQNRDAMLRSIGQNYGARSPDLAFEWASGLAPPSNVAVQAVLSGIAQVDSNRAIDLFMEYATQSASSNSLLGLNDFATYLSFSSTLSNLAANTGEVERLADRLLALNHPNAESMLSFSISAWANRDVNAALDWALAHSDQLEGSVLRNLALRLAGSDLDLAVSTYERLAPEQQSAWIEGVMNQLANTDIDRALVLAESLRGQPAFETGMRYVIQSMARTDPEAAARLLDQNQTPVLLRNSIFSIAREWALRDPGAASLWAIEDIADNQARQAAVSQIASMWAQTDPDAAERWLFSINSGPDRDAAANGLLLATIQAGEFDARLLDAYSSDQAGQQGLSRAIIQIARTNPDQASELTSAYISDPDIRDQIEEQIAQLAARSSGALSGSSVIIF